ncbi:hypothetical protein [Candidatus Collinsella stercoripullorum]|uniref:hypothetical protein n=1 Tax=Candidatus Collinsella stercoripullorum TaxID=2838522 RepID=UPI0022E79C99|nr:hypothetical protein [Candidatus Collinsella stercoripullorum]
MDDISIGKSASTEPLEPQEGEPEATTDVESISGATLDEINGKLDLLLNAVGVTYVKEEKHEG